MIFCLLLASVLSYSSPVNYDVALAGNFAEPRPNHFHGGVDLKTGGVVGKPIFSIADGHVSAVSIGIGGYGNALYISHPDGRTSFYCHLKSFAPTIEKMLKARLYGEKKIRGLVRFHPTDLPVSEGQLVAISGNTGASQAPHLHLEMHDSRTGAMLDPLDYIGDCVIDKYPPMAHGFMAYPISGQGTFCGNSFKQSFGFSSHNLARVFTAWGRVGFGIWANDYMEATYNRYGVRRTELYVDDNLVFMSDLSEIPMTEHLQVNAWGDYEHYLRRGVWYMRSYVPHGVSLPVFWYADDSRGTINFNEEHDYHLRYVLTDFKGNASTYTFVVRGVPHGIGVKPVYKPLSMISYDRPIQYRLPGLLLTAGSGNVAEAKELRSRVLRSASALSDAYYISTTPLQLFHYATVGIRLKRKVRDVTKLYVTCRGGRVKYLGGRYQDGWLYGRVRNLNDIYEIAQDTLPPKINAVGMSSWNARKTITLSVSDTDSGVNTVETYLDGTYILFEDVPKSAWMRCNLKETPVKPKGRSRNLEVVATDNCGNTSRFVSKVMW